MGELAGFLAVSGLILVVGTCAWLGIRECIRFATPQRSIASGRGRRRNFRFSLAALFGFTTIAAFVLLWWRLPIVFCLPIALIALLVTSEIVAQVSGTKSSSALRRFRERLTSTRRADEPERTAQVTAVVEETPGRKPRKRRRWYAVRSANRYKPVAPGVDHRVDDTGWYARLIERNVSSIR